MFGKLIAGVVMGIVVAILSFLVFGLGTGAGEAGASRGGWAALIGFTVMLVLALTATRSSYAWGRGLLLCGLLCFAMPLATMVFSGIIGAQQIGAAPTEAGRAGAALGTAMAGGFMTIVTGVFGFFLGLIFLIGSYFSLRTR
jgi:hypothetical protein